MSMLPANAHRVLEAPVKPAAFISVTHGMSGYFAVKYWWNDEHPELGGFWEPWDTGLGRYPTKLGAREEAVAWAADEGLEYKEG